MRSRVRTTKVQLPRQRGRRGPSAHVIDLGRGAAPVVVVIPERPTLGRQLAYATGSALWRHRAAWAPTWGALGLFTAAGLLSVAAPAAGIVLTVPALLVPAGWALVRRWHPRSAVRRRARALRLPVLLTSAVALWTGAACLFGTINWPLFGLWAAATATGQAAWWRSRRTVPTVPLQP
ncbi:hypothetical protein GCM10010495_14600 [Kitasatospora herbaricolor]|uniref:hypothetical protein n=1 Tax=Kitasatospora herbaricolor TaxID=68217 RepID=UPI0017491AAE|nr:hypothetical protein [Kitasatospora herbaricolor]MDQ0309267.1 hypothetical protein [Kitasatospora herbaricolor]GGV04025.1 hypothetical protein GCM10010495_14600 [Kitasatospora herbaricolor]